MRIYLCNLPFRTTLNEVEGLLGEFGAVMDARLVFDRDTGKPKGYAFANMDPGCAQKAIDGLDGIGFGGRRIVVREANERKAQARPPERTPSRYMDPRRILPERRERA